MLEPRDHLVELDGDGSSVLDGYADALLIACGSALAPAHLSPHELAQGDAHWGRPEAGAVGGPDVIADLHPRHAVAWPCGLSPGPFSTQLRSLAHVNAVYDASLGATVCCEAERSDAERLGSLCGQPGRLAGAWMLERR